MSTKFTKGVVINAPGKEVVFDGVDFTQDCNVNLTDATAVTFRNCRFYGINPYTFKSYVMFGMKYDTPIKLVIENCFFGDNKSGTYPDKPDKKQEYEFVVEGTFGLADGSSICNNYFTADCCKINVFSHYSIAEGATVKFCGNVFERSANAVRIGFKGSPNCTVIMENNTYYKTDDANPDYAGLLLIQPFNKDTVSMNGVTVKIDKTKNMTKHSQLVYLYSDETDTPFNKTSNYPKVYIDGQLLEKIPHPASVVVEGEE